MTKKGMTIFTPDKAELMEIETLSRSGDNLIIKGTIMGAMPMSAVVPPEQVRRAFGLLNFKLILFLLSMPFRR